ncbi:MAG: hypothetical protein FDW93_02290 [Bergeyella sp.]|nr:hypothetical protein [Bergeyella sp.]
MFCALLPNRLNSLYNHNGVKAVDLAFAQECGKYLVRGNIKDFGVGELLLDEACYKILGGRDWEAFLLNL